VRNVVSSREAKINNGLKAYSAVNVHGYLPANYDRNKQPVIDLVSGRIIAYATVSF